MNRLHRSGLREADADVLLGGPPPFGGRLTRLGWWTAPQGMEIVAGMHIYVIWEGRRFSIVVGTQFSAKVCILG